jgi:hypothetical protein
LRSQFRGRFIKHVFFLLCKWMSRDLWLFGESLWFWENLGIMSSLFLFDRNFNLLLYNLVKHLLTECHKADSNPSPKFYFSICYKRNFVYCRTFSL